MSIQKSLKNQAVPQEGSVSISIIIPVYNAQKFLDDCLSSIAAQTFRNWECICVDDGSTDESPNIINDFIEKDPRFRLIQQKNGGHSSACNTGLMSAQGDYFTFVDGDDFVHPEILEKMLSLSKAHNADLVVCDFLRFESIDEYERRAGNPDLLAGKIEVLDRPLLPGMGNWKKFRPECWGKLYLSEQHNMLRFPSNLIAADDLYASFDVFERSNRAVFTSTPYYFYRVVYSSLGRSTSKYYNYIHDLPEVIVHANIVFKRNNISIILQKKIIKMWVGLFFSFIYGMSVNPGLSKDEKKRIVSLAFQGLIEIKQGIAGSHGILSPGHYFPYFAIQFKSLLLLGLWQRMRSSALWRWTRKIARSNFAASRTDVFV